MQRPKIVPLPQREQAPKYNLPLQPTPLIGREQEVEAVLQLLRRPHLHLLTLTGSPGIGKTRLALQVATELIPDFADGVYFVPLAPIREPDLVASTIAQVLGLRESGHQSFLNLLKVFLQDKHLLLLLDNFEQIVTAAPFVAELLSTCSELKMLVTSREVLHVRVEQQFPVSPLSLPDLKALQDTEALSQYAAITLFLQRAQAVDPIFEMNKTNGHTIAEICTRLDGLPLAIELAAVRIKLFSPQALLARLDHQLKVLTHGPYDLPERQQTLRKTIQWSYDLLTAHEQQLLRWIAVFVGGCTLEAVEAICTNLGDRTRNLGDEVLSLLDKNLLQRIGQADGKQRLMILEMVREYGLECLIANGEADIARRAHADYYLALAEAAEPELRGPQQDIWFERLERELDNLWAALRWLIEREELELSMRLYGALWWFWLRHGDSDEEQTFLERALAASEGVTVSVRAKVLNLAARVILTWGDVDRAERLGKESLALCRERGDIAGIALSFYVLGGVD